MGHDDTTRVRAYEKDKERINDLKRGDDTQADVIRRLLDGEGGEGPFPDASWDEDMDIPVDLDANIGETLDATKADIEDINAGIAEVLDELDALTAGEWQPGGDGGSSGRVDYTDIVNATKQAIREELPVEEMGR